MPAAEFMEAMLYEQIEPFGGRRGDVQAAVICATVANLFRGSDVPAYKLSDFIPEWDEPAAPTQTPEQQLHIMLALQAAQNAIVKAREEQD